MYAPYATAAVEASCDTVLTRSRPSEPRARCVCASVSLLFASLRRAGAARTGAVRPENPAAEAVREAAAACMAPVRLTLAVQT